MRASARVIIVCFFIASLFLILFLSAKVRQKSQTAQHLLFKYQSFSVFFVILQPLIEMSIYNRYIIKDDSQFE